MNVSWIIITIKFYIKFGQKIDKKTFFDKNSQAEKWFLNKLNYNDQILIFKTFNYEMVKKMIIFTSIILKFKNKPK